MRALIMASASFDTVMAPSRTCVTNSFTRFLPRSLDAGSRAMRPSCTVWSRRLTSSVVSAPCDAAAAFCKSLMAGLLGFHLGLQLGQLVLVGNGFAEHLFEFVITLHRAAKVGKAIAQLEQLAQRANLARHVLR